jgi:LmbE family N-acetylglucosaminyl deacetylase
VAGLLFILPHPDDETFSAGAIARYSAAGVEVGLICATRGERGATADLCTIEELPGVREAEMRDAGRILGARYVEMLPYEDQKLWTAPIDEIRRQITAILRRQKPQIVVTFDPNGNNQHTDHIVMSRFVADAVSTAADPRWYPELGRPHTVDRILWQWPQPLLKLGAVPELGQQPGVDFLIDVAGFRKQKEAAIRAHRTQFPGLRTLFNSDARLSLEAFRLGFGARPQTTPASDLFAI